MSSSEPEALWDLPEKPPAAKAVPSRARKKAPKPGEKAKGAQSPAPELPVARIVVDIPLAHLDRTFDYLVPEKLHETAVPGCRVRVRFAGQLVDGYLIERGETSDYGSKLAFLDRVTSAEPVLPPSLHAVCRAVADRYGGTLSDVLRLAIPPRHAKAEGEPPVPPAGPPEAPDPTAWARYQRGPAFVEALAEGKPANAVWQALPGEDWPRRLAEAAGTVAASGRGAVLVVPDHRDLTRVHAACAAVVGEDAVVALIAGLGPAERYRRWLAVLRGAVRVVVGTRAAMFAPVRDPGLFAVWDDGDDLHLDQHAPYPHVRDVLMDRAHAAKASLLVGGFARTAEAQLLVESGWAAPVLADRVTLRAAAPRVTPVGEDFDVARDEAARVARLPAVAFEAARQAFAADLPALVQVPRRGYVPGLACGHCRTPAHCRRCAGPLALPGGSLDGHPKPPACRWCGVPETAFRCPACGSVRLRAVIVGAKRTAEELGRAFPGVPVRTSGAAEVLESVPGKPALVVCTPGAEPVADGGYGAALLLDGWALLGRQDLRAGEETLRRWMAAAALVRPAAAGGRVIVGAEAGLAVVQALVRWDPAWHAAQELSERRELGFPPAMRMASIEGSPDAVAALLEDLPLPESGEVLGPVPIGELDEEGNAERERALVRVSRAEGKALAASIHAAAARRDARKATEPIRIQVDPLELI
ncbi:primosomal protein N'/primosome assembly protein PriA [Amycolatopsis mediterranei S699]|uniref:Probable replication restart protein PriA n=1 Tax=Amycolatopsis mediterranei (strain U-32) TaxID=749927 RepID=A0A0H3D0V1_AMYMU|nr:primosomal protein N' [Amycolatopsis mediterranei]ADJ44554.1 primosomal protein N'/primosome assembly protein PriA [Amycolatopsis mediterranei U32]AFO76267.1 primosomal protein N'/primosome assembly protein PriA [Amycolatopsis mediterranei S699]AGT83396.1 primosomal protein N'/primosome assembly protein PriA [Amycolatopsis mediterranei RB]KDO07088.1 primosome assembly protein PriA [Amycolatopsis mediterranei]KDU92563.1 primosome assembly protein PriA [Amycolatopsis mediterranei]